MGIKKEIIYNLESNCLFHLQSACDYFLAHDQKDDDYSLEFAIHETLYSFEVLKRSLNTKFNQSDTYYILENSISEFIKGLNQPKLKNRFSVFLNEYFSESRYKKLLDDLAQNTKTISFNDDLTHADHQAIDYFLILDKIHLIKKSQFVNFLEIDLTHLEKKLEIVFNQYEDTWSYFSEVIKSAQNYMLVPESSEYSYWTKYSYISIQNINEIFESYFEAKLQNQFITESIINNIPSSLANIKSVFSESISKLRKLSKFNDIIDEVLNIPVVEPNFATYAKTQHNEFNLMPHFSNYSGSLDSLIEQIENLDIEDKEKLHLLSTLYTIFGKHDKAKDILK